MNFKINKTITILCFIVINLLAESEYYEKILVGPLSEIEDTSEVVKYFGKYNNIKITEKQNVYDSSYVDYFFNYSFPDFDVEYFWLSKKHIGFMTKFETKSDKFCFMKIICTGMTEKEIEDVLGKAQNEGNNYLEYNDDSYTFVKFFFIENLLSKVLWKTSID